MQVVITHACPNLKGSLAKPPLKWYFVMIETLWNINKCQYQVWLVCYELDIDLVYIPAIWSSNDNQLSFLYVSLGHKSWYIYYNECLPNRKLESSRITL